MPKIAQYEPDQVQTRISPQPLAQDAPAAAFGEPIVKGALDVIQAGAELKQRVDTTAAEEALVSFERDKNDLFFNPESGYFNTVGRDAYDNSPAAMQALEDLKLKYGETLGQQAKQMFDKSADVHIIRGQMDVSKHSAKGLKTWEVATIESQVENSIENASLYWNEPDRLKVQNVVGRQAVLDSAELMGIGPEATAEKLQTFESSFARSSVEAAIQSSSVDGKEALSTYGDKLEGPDKVKLEGMIEAKEKVEKTKADAEMAVTTATNLIDTYDDRSDIIAEVKKIEDVELQKKTMSEAMSQFSRKKTAESEARASAFENAEDHILKGGSAESFKMNNPEQWELMSPKQQSSIQSGAMATTDWDTFSDLMLLPKSELAKVDPTDHFNKLAKAERSKLISAVKSANGKGSSKDKIDHQVGRTRSAQTTAAVEQLFGKKTKWNDAKREQANGFYSLLDEEVRFRESEKDASLTSEEFTDILSGLTRNVVQEGYIFDSELDLTDIPAEDVPVLSRFLRDNGVPVTADNLIKAHKQASD
jgi:hypothetical protein